MVLVKYAPVRVKLNGYFHVITNVFRVLAGFKVHRNGYQVMTDTADATMQVQ